MLDGVVVIGVGGVKGGEDSEGTEAVLKIGVAVCGGVGG